MWDYTSRARSLERRSREKFEHKKSARVGSGDTTIDFHQKLATIMFLTRLVIVQNIHSTLPSTPAVVVSSVLGGDLAPVLVHPQPASLSCAATCIGKALT